MGPTATGGPAAFLLAQQRPGLRGGGRRAGGHGRVDSSARACALRLAATTNSTCWAHLHVGAAQAQGSRTTGRAGSGALADQRSSAAAGDGVR